MCVSITRYILNANKNKKEETYPGPRPQTKLNTVIYSRTKKNTVLYDSQTRNEASKQMRNIAKTSATGTEEKQRPNNT